MHMTVQSPGLMTGSLALVALAGCAPQVDMSKVEDGLAKMQEKQDKILTRLDELEKKVAARPQPPQQQRPDSTTVYKVDVADAQWKGAKDAKITVVEWSDFQ
jgi:hypothetical protein